VSASTIIVQEKFTSTDEARETNTNFLPIIILHYKYLASTEKWSHGTTNNDIKGKGDIGK
jgi:hypothetical protein